MRLRRDRKETRQEDAKDRQTAYNALSNEERIEKLDKKLGKGLGAKKQRAKFNVEK